MPRKHKDIQASRSNKKDTGKKDKDLSLDAVDKRNLAAVRRQLKKIDAQSEEGNQWSSQPHEGIKNLIEAKEAEKQAFESAFSQLREDIQKARKAINKIKENKKLSRDTSIDQQLKVLEKYPHLKELIKRDLEEVQKEQEFLKRYASYREGYNEAALSLHKAGNHLKHTLSTLFNQSNIDIDITLKNASSIKISKFTTVDSFCQNTKNLIEINPSEISKLVKRDNLKRDWLNANQTFKNALLIAHYREQKEAFERLPSHRERISNRIKNFEKGIEQFNKAKEKFKAVIYTNETKMIEQAYLETMQIQTEYDCIKGALQILNGAYKQQLRHHKEPENVSRVEIKSTLVSIQHLLNTSQAEENYQRDRDSLKVCNDGIDKYKNIERDVYKQDRILAEGSNLAITYLIEYEAIFESPLLQDKKRIAFYDFIENNIPHRISNSLDELQNKSQEAISFLEEEISSLEHHHYQEQLQAGGQRALEKLRVSTLHDQPKEIVTEKEFPADKLQKHVEASLQNVEMTDTSKQIVTSYLCGLFEKSHHKTVDEKTITNFFQENFEEAKQVGTYIEQKYFMRKPLQEDAIKLAIHLKHEFGSPIYQTMIDANFNIVNADAASSSSAPTYRLDINRQGKILKDQREQRVYLIGFQDQAESSSNDAQTKPMALFALQAKDPGYLKFGAGTPLPTGGVVDVKTAQKTTRDQPNLYKATLGIETLQETQGQKEIDMRNLELFETETVKNYRNQAHLYDITMFTGNVKDTHTTAPAHDSKEYQETTGPCMVDINKLIAGVNKEFNIKGTFRFKRQAEKLIKRQVAIQALGIDAVPKSDQDWQTNGETRWADFYEASTSMNLFAKYVVLHYREELGLR